MGASSERETQPVPRYDAIVSLDQGEVEVIIGLDPDRVHLRAGDLEIGNWGADECAIAHLGEGVYAITAENESLHFVPKNPRLFEEGLNHGTGYGLSAAPLQGDPVDQRGRHTRKIQAPTPVTSQADAPPPKPLTLALFYMLATVTAGLGVWAIFRMI